MTDFTLTSAQVRELLGPVVEWTGIDHQSEPLNFVRVVSDDGWLYATASNGHSAVIARVPSPTGTGEAMIHREYAERLLAFAHPARETRSLEITGDDERLLFTIAHDDLTSTIIEGHTIAPVANATFQRAIAPLAQGNVGAVNLSSDDLIRLGSSLAHLKTTDRLGAAGATIISTSEGRSGWCIAAHTNRYLAMIPATGGDLVPGAIKPGTRLPNVSPLTAWPEVLTDTGL